MDKNVELEETLKRTALIVKLGVHTTEYTSPEGPRNEDGSAPWTQQAHASCEVFRPISLINKALPVGMSARRQPS